MGYGIPSSGATSQRPSVAVVAVAQLAFAAVLSAHVQPAPFDQQNQPPVFRTRVDLVEVDFVATDAANRRVLDLRKEELQILEDGRPRDLASLSLVDVPLASPHPPYARDVFSNERTEQGRLFFLVLDDVNTLRERTASIRAVAKRFVEHLSPGDQLALSWLSLGKTGAREFTTNHAAVLEAIDRFSATATRVSRMNPRDTPLPTFRGFDDQPTADAGDLALKNIKADFDRSRPFQMLHDVCAHLATLPHRRKAVVFVGSGPTGMHLEESSSGPPNRDLLDFTRAVTAARRANVAVYALDPSPAQPTAPRAATPGRRVALPLRHPEGAVANGAPPDRESEALPLLELARAGRACGLEMLSLATGGIESSGPALLSAVDRVVSDTGSYYLLGYYADPPTGRPLDKVRGLFDPFNGFRSIEVRTTRPGVTIRARKGYWAGETGAAPDRLPAKNADEMAAASIAGVLPLSDLPLRAFAAPLRGKTASRSDVAVIVEASLPALAPTSLGMPLQDDVDMVIAAVAPGQGVQATARAKVRLSLGPVAQAGPVPPRYQLCARVAVAPGHYQVRVGVRSGLAGKTGSVYVDLTVPDVYREPASMSGLFLERRRAATPLAAVSTRTFASLVPFVPTLDRDFGADDEVWAHLRAYRAKRADRGPQLVTASVSRPDDGAVVWIAEESKPARTYGSDNGTDYEVRLPLSTLTPGAYRLRIALEGNGDLPVGREVDFRLREGAAAPDQAVTAKAPSALARLLDSASRYAKDCFGGCGCGAGVTFDQSVLKQVGWEMGTEVEITLRRARSETSSLFVSPSAQGKPQASDEPFEARFGPQVVEPGIERQPDQPVRSNGKRALQPIEGFGPIAETVVHQRHAVRCDVPS